MIYLCGTVNVLAHNSCGRWQRDFDRSLKLSPASSPADTLSSHQHRLPFLHLLPLRENC